MTATWYSVSFTHDGIHYNGRITPETKNEHSLPSSWHVVLNDVFFGYLHKDNDKWHVSEQRPAALVQAVGKQIDGAGYEIHMN